MLEPVQAALWFLRHHRRPPSVALHQCLAISAVRQSVTMSVPPGVLVQARHGADAGGRAPHGGQDHVGIGGDIARNHTPPAPLPIPVAAAACCYLVFFDWDKAPHGPPQRPSPASPRGWFGCAARHSAPCLPGGPHGCGWRSAPARCDDRHTARSDRHVRGYTPRHRCDNIWAHHLTQTAFSVSAPRSTPVVGMLSSTCSAL